jgi:RNA polymerase sigma-70 factor (ECF subfamily)
MVAVNQVRRAFGQFESRLVRVNGQPGRLLLGPGERQYGDAERLAAGKGLALLRAGEIDPGEAAAFMIAALGLPDRTTRVVADDEAEVGVREVLTVDVVDGRIQAVRMVRNPDKLDRL